MKMCIDMNPTDNVVMVLTPEKTKYHTQKQKYYKKKQEKKKRDRIIQNHRRMKLVGNDIYSQKEYGRHNGSKPFQIYDRFDLVDVSRLMVNQQFMTRKEYNYSDWLYFEHGMYGNDDGDGDTESSSSSSDDDDDDDVGGSNCVCSRCIHWRRGAAAHTRYIQNQMIEINDYSR